MTAVTRIVIVVILLLPACLNLNSRSIAGQWSCIKISTPGGTPSTPGSDVGPSGVTETPGLENWLIDGDSIWTFIYPCQFVGVDSYRISNDSVFLNNSPEASATIEFRDEMMIVHKLFKHQLLSSLTFVADTFEQTVINVLLRDTVNSACLTGVYTFKQCFCNQKVSDRRNDCKIRVRSELKLDSSKAAAISNGTEIIMRVGMRKRSFRVVNYSWADYEGQFVNAYSRRKNSSTVITLMPGSWWEGDPVELKYVLKK